MKRRDLSVLIGLFALSLALASCSPDLEEWPENAVYTVATLDDGSYLVALTANDHNSHLIASLASIGVDDPTSVRVIEREEGDPVLAWNSDNGPTRFAIIDETSSTVRATNIAVDSGAFTVIGDSVFALLPFVDDRARVEEFSLDGGGSVGTIDLLAFPQLFADGAAAPLVLGVDNGSLYSETLDSSSVSELEGLGTLGDALVGPNGVIYSLAADGTSVPASVVEAGDGGVRILAGVSDPRLLALAEGTLLVDDTVDGVRTIRIVDLESWSDVAVVTLDSSDPIQALTVDNGVATVLQGAKVTWIDLADFTVETTVIPGFVIAEW